MIIKFFLAILVLLIFNGCAQNAALLGPIYTIGTTGNVAQAGVSYGTSYAIKKVRNKSAYKNINTSLKKKNLKKDIKENPDDFFRIVKKYVKKSDKIYILANQ